MNEKAKKRIEEYRNTSKNVLWSDYDTARLPNLFKNGSIPFDCSLRIIQTYYFYVIYNYKNKSLINDNHFIIVESFKKYMNFIDNKTLKKEINYLINEIETYVNNIIKEDLNDPRFYDILVYFMNHEDSLVYIKELLRRIPEANCARKNDKHILVYAYELFLDNYLKMCRDKKSNYINKDFLKEVIYLLTSYKYELTPEDVYELCSIYGKFNYEISFVKKEKRKKKINYDVNFVMDVILKVQKHSNQLRIQDLSERLVVSEFNSVYTSSESSNKNSCSNNVPESAFTYNDSNYAYSVYRVGNGFQVRIHVKKVDGYIGYDSHIFHYLKNKLLEKDNPDCYFTFDDYEPEVDYMQMKKNGVYDTFSFVFDFNDKGSVTNFDIKKSRVKIDFTERLSQSNEFLQERIDIKPVIDDLRDIYLMNYYRGVTGQDHTKNRNRINDFFKELLSECFAKYVKDNHLPCILYGTDLSLNEKLAEHVDNLAPALSRLDKKDYNKIKNMFGSTIIEDHYTYTGGDNYKYKIDLLDPMSYIGLEIKKMIAVLVFNDRNYSDEYLEKMFKYYRNYFILLSKELNQNKQAIDMDDLANFKGKLSLKDIQINGNIKNLK